MIEIKHGDYVRRDILNYIIDYRKCNGFAPSIREIGQSVGLKSTSTVHSHLKVLEERGMIRKNGNSPRTLVVLKKYV